jgi:tetratricopeptide (TPR) repeat protein
VREPRGTGSGVGTPTPASASAAASPVESELTPGYTVVRVDGARVERAVRAHHRRELRARPAESQPHAWASYDLLRDLLDRAQMALPLPAGPTSSPLSEYSRQRQIFEERQLEWEKRIARHHADKAAQAVRHAEKAFQHAATPQEELQARRILGDAYRFAGRYDDAIRQFAWIASVEPYGDRGMLMRCFAHKGYKIRWENRGGNYWATAGGRDWPIGMRAAGPFIEATRKWLRRWPDSSFLRSRLGNFYYSRALQEATQHPDFPRPGKEFGQRVDACIWRHARPWVEAGLREFQAAVDLADSPGERARALAELGHGHLIRADYKRAIPLLTEALVLEPWNRGAQDYLRQAYRRRKSGQGRVVTAARPPGGWYTEGYGLPPLNSSFSGYGFGSPRLSREDVAEARAILTRLRQSAPTRVASAAVSDTGAAAASGRLPGPPAGQQQDRNRLDVLLPGVGTRYQPVTGDVLAVDLEHAEARLSRLERLGLVGAR